MEYAEAKGFDCVAAGHYARIVYDGGRGRYLLKRGLDESKDQSCMHCAMIQDRLARTLFPLGELLPQKGGTLRVMFERPQRAIAPGQAAVFYEKNTVLGGGIILEAIK